MLERQALQIYKNEPPRYLFSLISKRHLVLVTRSTNNKNMTLVKQKRVFCENRAYYYFHQPLKK